MKTDTDFQEYIIKKVEEQQSGWTVAFDSGWSFYIPEDSPVTPAVGMTARLYGEGIGSVVRGLQLNGETVFYRTGDEQKAKQEADSYGVNAADWLSRWDAGKTVWSIEMGGLGPGYEQAIQITVAEILRHLLDAAYNSSDWGDNEKWARDQELIERASFDNETIHRLGLSGAQYGAALSLATKLYGSGPIQVMKDDAVKDRHIQVCKNFPG